jgi:hypothetical protein
LKDNAVIGNRPIQSLSPLPLAPTTDLRDGLSRLLRTIAQAREVAGQMELGQAQRPLGDHFAALESALDTPPFTLTLLALEPESQAAALGWLCGEQELPLPPKVLDDAGVLEIHLTEAGYALRRGEQRRVFDQRQQLLEAVQEASLPREGPLQMELAAPGGAPGLRLLLTTPPLLLDRPGLLTRLLAESSLLLIAGRAEGEPDEVTTGVIHEVRSGIQACWLVLYGSGPAADTALSPVPAIRLDPTGPVSPVPAGLADPRTDLRVALSGSQQARRLEASIQMLEDRLGQDVRQQDVRRKTLQRRAAVLAEPEKDRELREAAETSRRRLEEEFGKLEVGLAERLRERLLPTSSRMNRIKNLMEDLSDEHMSEESSGPVVHLGVSGDFLGRARHLLQDVLREDLRADYRWLDTEVKALAGRAAARVGELMGQPAAARPELPAEETLWETLRKAIHIDVNYRAEAPRRGLLDLMGHGRRPVMILTMTLSLVGAAFGFGGGMHVFLAPLMLVVFLLALVWTFREFKHERHERIDRELHRLREVLGSQLKRLYEQVLQDWQGRALRHLRDLHRELAAHVEDPLRARAAELNRKNALERKEIQDKLKIIDGRLRELGGLGQQVQRVRQAALEARQVLERAARQAQQPPRAAR